MPKLTRNVPQMRHFKPRNLARVRINGQDIYLGKWKSPEAQREYDRLIAEYLAHGRKVPEPVASPHECTVTELIDQYWAYAKEEYGFEPGTAAYFMRPTLRSLKELYGETPVSEFGPRRLKAFRESWIKKQVSRRYINEIIWRVRDVFRWAASEELIPASIPEALRQVTGLKKRRSRASGAKESRPVPPVDDAIVDMTVPYLPATIADMVRFQRLTGARPSEVCLLRPCDINRSQSVWVYIPERHKTERFDKNREIAIGPRAQEILRPYLLRPHKHYCFSPRDSERKRLRERHAARITPASCGNRPGTNRQPQPAVSPGERYTRDSYRRAVYRACDQAFPPPAPLARRADESGKQWKSRLTASDEAALAQWRSDHRWSPNQLRHTFATEVRRDHGLESAQVLLGHSKADTTEIYAERDRQLACKVALLVG
ncbi:MAG: tyrosine-type recombinase/integrase [Pirellulaceae bacterium]